MCLTAQAFGMFLSVLGMQNLTVETGKVTIHTASHDVQWIAVGPKHWCTPSNKDFEA